MVWLPLSADTYEDDQEGLYDEPSFEQRDKQIEKSNPMYSSQEDLSAPADMDEGGGYLDVAPDEEDDEDESYIAPKGNDDEDE